MGLFLCFFKSTKRELSEPAIRNLILSGEVVRVEISEADDDEKEKVVKRSPYQDISNQGLLVCQKDVSTQYGSMI